MCYMIIEDLSSHKCQILLCGLLCRFPIAPTKIVRICEIYYLPAIKSLLQWFPRSDVSVECVTPYNTSDRYQHRTQIYHFTAHRSSLSFVWLPIDAISHRSSVRAFSLTRTLGSLFVVGLPRLYSQHWQSILNVISSSKHMWLHPALIHF